VTDVGLSNALNLLPRRITALDSNYL